MGSQVNDLREGIHLNVHKSVQKARGNLTVKVLVILMAWDPRQLFLLLPFEFSIKDCLPIGCKKLWASRNLPPKGSSPSPQPQHDTNDSNPSILLLCTLRGVQSLLRDKYKRKAAEEVVRDSVVWCAWAEALLRVN